MRKSFRPWIGILLLGIFTQPVALADEPTGKKLITFEAVYGPDAELKPFQQSAPRFSWLPGGEYLLRKTGGRYTKIHAATGKESPLFDTAAIAASLQGLPGIDSARAQRLALLPRGKFNHPHGAALLSHAHDLFYCRLDGSFSRRLTNSSADEELAALGPEGKFAAFVRDHDLYVVDIATQTERRLTSDGTELIRNGKADWVYYEEVFDRDSQAFWFSGDGKRIAFLRFDDTPVGKFAIADNVPATQKVNQGRYPQAGTPNPLVTVGVAGVEESSVQWIDLSAYPAHDRLVVRIGWLPDHRSLYLYVQNRIQTFLDVLLLKPGTTVPQRLLRQTTEAWVNVPGPPQFLNDGSFLLTDERTGWRHISRYSTCGKKLATLTSGRWAVRRMQHVDQAGGWAYFTGSCDAPLEDHLFRAPLCGGTPQRLTAAAGTHRIRFSPTGNYYLDTHSNTDTPPKTDLRETDGQRLRQMCQTTFPDLQPYQLGKFERVQIPARDGVSLDGSLLMPANFDPTRRYPVWCRIYGGPHYPTVRNRWLKSYRLFDELLAAQGIVVFRIDPRSASGKGARSAWAAYRQLGRSELCDLEDAVGWLKSQSWADAGRIGIGGHSYGGFLTAYAMTHCKLFAAGIAGAPVTDWRNYDTIYTERYMDTPAANPQGYEDASVVGAAGNLHGRLLLLHGLLDDNVHAQNSIRLSDALQQAGRKFEIMIYPRARHAIHGAHYARTKYDFIMKTMRPGDNRQ